jgi:hypothetical protein
VSFGCNDVPEWAGLPLRAYPSAVLVAASQRAAELFTGDSLAIPPTAAVWIRGATCELPELPPESLALRMGEADLCILTQEPHVGRFLSSPGWDAQLEAAVLVLGRLNRVAHLGDAMTFMHHHAHLPGWRCPGVRLFAHDRELSCVERVFDSAEVMDFPLVRAVLGAARDLRRVFPDRDSFQALLGITTDDEANSAYAASLFTSVCTVEQRRYLDAVGFFAAPREKAALLVRLTRYVNPEELHED